MPYLDWRERFLEAVDQSLYPAAWLDKRVADGRARFWGNERAAILAEIQVLPSGLKQLNGVLAAGELDAIQALIVEAETWGRRRGCARAVIESRPGWERVMATSGYAVEQVKIAKNL